MRNWPPNSAIRDTFDIHKPLMSDAGVTSADVKFEGQP